VGKKLQKFKNKKNQEEEEENREKGGGRRIKKSPYSRLFYQNHGYHS
jgi:hypothetical protein